MENCNVQVFSNKEFGSVRTVVIDNEPWFVGKDVAEILGYSNPSKAVYTHVGDEDKQFIMLNIADSLNGNLPIGQSKTAFINKSGLYSLILSSKLPNAKRLKKWVFDEILSNAHKTNRYICNKDNTEVINGMKNSVVQVFNNKEFGSVRTVVINGEPWFCAVDIARMLGYSDTAKAVKAHCQSDGWANYPVIDSMGRTQDARFLTEGNVWRLIIHSKLQKAQEVEHWIMNDVLPAIRKTGGYIYGEENMTDDELVYKAFIVLQNKLEQREQQIQELTTQIEAQKPKVEFADRVTKADNCIDLNTFAKYLKRDNIPIGRNRLFEWLREKKILMKGNIPYQAYLEAGAFKVIEKTYVRNGVIYTYSQTLITGKGQYAIAKVLGAELDKKSKELIS